MKSQVFSLVLLALSAGCSARPAELNARDRLITVSVPNEIYGAINWSLYASEVRRKYGYCQVYFTEAFRSPSGAPIRGADFGSTGSSFLTSLASNDCSHPSGPYARVIDITPEQFAGIRAIFVRAVTAGDAAGLSARTLAALQHSRLITFASAGQSDVTVSFLSDSTFYSLRLAINSKRMTVLAEDVWQ